MNLPKVIARFHSAPDSEGELRRVARALGNELSNQRPELLRTFRAEMARVPVPEQTYASGYVAGMLDVTAEYESTVRSAQDDDELERLVQREGWREVLRALAEGPKLPSELASQLGKDRSTVTRILRRLRSRGLIQAVSDRSDGRMRPHRLTADGQRAVANMRGGISTDVERGIRIAVHLFHYLLEHASGPASALDTIAESVLGDSEAATAAVSTWARESERAGMVAADRNLATGRMRYHVTPPTGTPTVVTRSDVLWQSVPHLLQQRRDHKSESIPIFVRTREDGWAAWAHALRAADDTGMSRTIVQGDLVSGAVTAPEARFDLLYDDPGAIHADRQEPAMRDFLERADDKFVITYAQEEVPDDFIQLPLIEE